MLQGYGLSLIRSVDHPICIGGMEVNTNILSSADTHHRSKYTGRPNWSMPVSQHNLPPERRRAACEHLQAVPPGQASVEEKLASFSVTARIAIPEQDTLHVEEWGLGGRGSWIGF